MKFLQEVLVNYTTFFRWIITIADAHTLTNEFVPVRGPEVIPLLITTETKAAGARLKKSDNFTFDTWLIRN